MCSKINECYIFVCILFEICQTRTSKFRRVIRQHTDGMLGSIIWILLEIHFSFQAWKSFENPLKMTKLSPWVWCTTFWDTVQNGVLTRWFKNFYMFCRFDRIPACDRRTPHSPRSRGKKCPVATNPVSYFYITHWKLHCYSFIDRIINSTAA